MKIDTARHAGAFYAIVSRDVCLGVSLTLLGFK